MVRKMIVDYDLIIVGCGPAGMNACLYATRANLRTLVIEKEYPGGKIVTAKKVENWIGTESIDGADLALSMFKHSFSYGGVYEQNNVLDIINKGEYKEVILKDKKYTCYAVIIATGISERKMKIKGDEQYIGKGVSYCAVCDGSLYKNQDVAVIGNSNHALEDVLYLTEIVNKVILINPEENFKASNYLISAINNNSKVLIYNRSKIKEIKGNAAVNSIVVEQDGEIIELDVSAVFPLLGISSDGMFAAKLGITDNNNYIKTTSNLQTDIEGIYAAGDCLNKPLKQVITATSDGAIAAIEAAKYIKNIKQKTEIN